MEPFYLAGSVVVLFFSQRILSKEISRLIHKFGGGSNAFVWFWSAIFLPGTLIHEVSHFLMAAATGTHTGKVDIFPEFIDKEPEPGEQTSVKLGSVQVAKMNPIQGFLVGMAPFITGSLLLVWLSTLLVPSFQTEEYFKFGLLAYLFFAVANSFFPSKEDLKHTIPFLVLVVLVILAAWYLGISVDISLNSRLITVVSSLSSAFILSFGVNALLILMAKFINRWLYN